MKTIDKKLEHLEAVLRTIYDETQPIDGHDDPGDIDDCWAEAFEFIEGVKADSRKNVWTAWMVAMGNRMGDSVMTHDRLEKRLGVHKFPEIKYEL